MKSTNDLQAEAKTLFQQLRAIDSEMRAQGQCLALNDFLTDDDKLRMSVTVNDMDAFIKGMPHYKAGSAVVPELMETAAHSNREFSRYSLRVCNAPRATLPTHQPNGEH